MNVIETLSRAEAVIDLLRINLAGDFGAALPSNAGLTLIEARQDSGVEACELVAHLIRDARRQIADRLARCNVTLYTCAVIKIFRHKGLQTFFETGSKAGIQPHHAARLKRQLTRLDLAAGPEAMNLPGWKLHPLTNGHWSVWVNGNWRMTFTFEGTDAVLVDYQDYH